MYLQSYLYIPYIYITYMCVESKASCKPVYFIFHMSYGNSVSQLSVYIFIYIYVCVYGISPVQELMGNELLGLLW